MSYGTRDELKASVLQRAANTTLNSAFDDVLALAEARLNRDVRHRRMLTRARYPADVNSPPAPSRYFPLPTNYLAMRSLILLVNPPQKLDYRSPDMLPYYQSTVKPYPEFYTTHRQIQLDQSYDWSGQFEMVYYERLPALVQPSDSNWLLEQFPDIYFFATMLESYVHLRNDDEAIKYESSYRGRIDEFTTQSNREDNPRNLGASRLNRRIVP